MVIATPAPLHVPQAIVALNQGCHLLIEKPLGVTTEGIGQLREAANSQTTTTAIAYVYRAHPVLTEMRAAILSGQFGRPLELVAVCGQHFPFYRPAYAQTYYTSRATGGGAIQDALTHIINAGQWLIGDIDRVVADAAHLRLENVKVEDTVHVLARQGAVLASYALNQHQAPNETTITVICERGTLRFENHENRWRSAVEPGEDWTDHPGEPLERDTLFTRQANAFLNACFEGAAPLCDLEQGIATLHGNLAILRSVESGQWQPVEKHNA